MKTSVRSLARAVAEIAQSLPEQEWTALAEAAAHLLIAQGNARDAHAFARLVEREWLKLSGTLAVRITTLSGSDAHIAQVVERIVRETLLRPCSVEQQADPSIIGGVRLQIGDERYDATLRGALNDLVSRLTAPIQVSQP